MLFMTNGTTRFCRKNDNVIYQQILKAKPMNTLASRHLFGAVTPDSLKARYLVVKNAWLDRAYLRRFGQHAIPLPNEISSYLRADNPKLIDLQHRCSKANAFTHTFWKNWRKHIDLANFRAEGAYLSQGSDGDAESLYFAQTVYLEAVDQWHLLQSLHEDGLFGCHAFHFPPDRLVSRDLLDSILEITFMRKALRLKQSDELRVLDIGAGYGRLAHRLLATFPNGHVTNIDAVPESTFLCDFYTRFRGVGDRSKTLAADEIDKLSGERFDIATNVHSWSECPRETVRRWMGVLRDLQVPMLFVVPHDDEFRSTERNGKDTFLPEITAVGYREVARARKFPESDTLQGASPVLYALFSL
jgi:putative sugar O-methyltransferase